MSDGEPVRFSGPPEPIRTEDGPAIVIPTGEPVSTGTPYRVVRLGTFVCQTCEAPTEEGAFWHDGTLQEPNQCPHCERNGPWQHEGGLSSATVEYAAQQQGYPPEGVEDADMADIWDAVEQYIRDHWDAKEDEIYAGLTAYAISTWIRPNLDFVPHLMLMGHTVSGKTRLLNTLARVSYRAVVSVDPSPASMYRMVDRYNMTFYLSEYHGLLKEKQKQIDSVIRAGQKRGEIVTRAGGGDNNPNQLEFFDPFTHVAVASQHTPDDDIVNRCIQIHSSRTHQDMPATHDEERAVTIRNQLLYARFRLLDSEEWSDCKASAYGFMEEHDITDRSREKLAGLITIAIRCARFDEAFGEFVKLITRQDEEASAESEDAQVIQIIRDLAQEEIANQAFIGNDDPYANIAIPYSAITDRYETVTNGIERTGHWVGSIRKRLDLESKRLSDGTVIKDPELRPKLEKLCEDHNIEFAPDEKESVEADIDDPRRTVQQHVERNYDPGEEFTATVVAAELMKADISPEQAGHILTNMAEQGDLSRDGDTFIKP